MTPEPEPRGPEPLRDQLFAAFCYPLAGGALLAYALAPVSDDLGPDPGPRPDHPADPLCLAAVRWRAHRTRAKSDPEGHRTTAAPSCRDRDSRAARR